MNQNTTGQMPYRLVKQVRGNEVLRKSFMELAMKTFSLNFRRWCEDGYWTERYIPYVLADGDRVIANVSVNRMDMLWRGQAKQYIQIGTVMTDEAYRGKGLSKFLIETVLHDWKDRCDAIYLFANRTVLDFYPKFGFVKAVEHQQSFAGLLSSCQPLFTVSDGEQRRAVDVLLHRLYEGLCFLFSATQCCCGSTAGGGCIVLPRCIRHAPYFVAKPAGSGGRGANPAGDFGL